MCSPSSEFEFPALFLPLNSIIPAFCPRRGKMGEKCQMFDHCGFWTRVNYFFRIFDNQFIERVEIGRKTTSHGCVRRNILFFGFLFFTSLVAVRFLERAARRNSAQGRQKPKIKLQKKKKHTIFINNFFYEMIKRFVEIFFSKCS